tara:strand:- start:21 stop:215 length:195 start_codon:yes stop_codon:yes gene_type:complete
MIGKRPRLFIIEKIMPHQSKVVKAAVTKIVPDTVYNGIAFNRCGYCGTKKPQCRKQKKCLKGLL